MSSVFLVEHYQADVNEESAATLVARLGQAAQDGALLIGSACVPADESFLSLLAAASAEDVAVVLARAGIVADRIVPALWLGKEEER